MATYTEMVQMVRDWSNRDEDVLTSANIKTFINFAADNVYRDLRIAPLEFTYIYPTQVIAEGVDRNTLAIPSDAIEFIQLRRKDPNSHTGYTVYSAKSDIRSFYQEYTTKYDDHFYTRERGNLVLYPNLKDSEDYELFYYRRLPEQDARYATGTKVPISAADKAADPDLPDTDNWFGLVPNWLRDENEKLILFGALAEAFTYLDEPDQAQKYASRFDQELRNLNDEENQRKYMGGNVQLHYQSFLI